MTEAELVRVTTPAKMPSAFRLFVNEKWMEHKDEIMAWTGQM